MKILVTGGAGFIGSALIRYLIEHTEHSVMNIDKLTYSGNLKSLDKISNSKQYYFKKIDICSRKQIDKVLLTFNPDAIMHLAAESHVDRSIDEPSAFIQTNIIGTYILLEATRTYWQTLPVVRQKSFRFLHISTDEVFGDLKLTSNFFTETTPYAPRSPYSASKASSDHLVRAWHHTYGLPTLITNCSNNYGPYQYPEKLIPLTIHNAISGNPIPIYGCGTQVRDWLYVEDHIRALYSVLTHGKIGDTYVIGGNNEIKNIDVVNIICSLLDKLNHTKPNGVAYYNDLIMHIKDRPGHDTRYAIDAKKIKFELDWRAEETFESGMHKTVSWYLKNKNWFINA